MGGGQDLAVVIGGSGAIGRSVVAELRTRGLGVIATHHGQHPSDPDAGTGWVPFNAASGDATGLRAAVDAVPNRLAVVVFAVGVPSSKRPVADTPGEEFARLFAVNALGLVTAWQALAARARAGAARLVVVSSDTVRVAGAGNGAYTASKAALEALALTLAKEEARHGVRVNVIAPSLVASPQAEQILAVKGVTDIGAHYAGLPAGRALTVQEVAGVIGGLGCDPVWDYATGTVVRLVFDSGAR
ncbi:MULTISPECIES: SDR family NAD(P)-dependent oxidoreductase [Micromonospora]|uniref:SDR family oxidoreductase n=1 Tax=Micromonospora solifontis TaxID=2487138 RepID=A0ABX9WBH8_9ACTN|nr:MULTISPECIES: SDR family oxidoreductase [Micromonospora]NES17050.1 SDR family oxidoreductase [Micromonospora sp. PPF5-17B]NES38574.1 SDR family oxidoreductase [Micromonospora solifontis]NES58794.1 SDR family oxidoreductase [Micromonospora sp. PPF5-6]RNL94549.1 SDR family oxidoreductase [Micromonospora solifontis]